MLNQIRYFSLPPVCTWFLSQLIQLTNKNKELQILQITLYACKYLDKMKATIDMNYVVDVFYFNMLRYNFPQTGVIILSPESRIQSCDLEFWILVV